MDTTSKYLFLIPALPLAGALFNLLIWRLLAPTTGKHRQPDWLTHLTAIFSVLGAFGLSCSLVAGPLFKQWKVWSGSWFSLSDNAAVFAPKPETMGGITQKVWTWIEVGDLKIDLAFRLDTLSAVMILVITGIGSLIHIYSVGYMKGEKRYPAYFGYLNLFTGMMLILVLGDNLPVMFIGWEGVGLCSYLLIGFWFEEVPNANAGRKAFIANRVGDFAFLLGICLLFYKTGTVAFPELQDATVIGEYAKPFLMGDRFAMTVALLFFIGACGKSAQIPLYVWLPDAMAGPTPVSALIHAATMVTAGVYMIARMSFLFSHSTTVMAIVAGVGALTALFAAIMAFAQTDLKKVLAYSTVSQLGFMFVAVGVGAYTAGIFHLVTHAFFKAGLFLAAGSIMHAMSGSGDITRMGGLRKLLPITHICFLVYCLAIAGIFPFAGFFSKDEVLAGAFGTNAQGWLPLYGEILWVVLSVAALGTAFYMWRLYFLVFSSDNRADEETKAHIHESPLSMTMPLVILAVFTVFIGAIGLPHVEVMGTHLPNFLHEWLNPALVDFTRDTLNPLDARGNPTPEIFVNLGQNMIFGLMGIALLIGLIGIGGAYVFYGRGPSEKVAELCETKVGGAVHRVVYNKFYVDEIYDSILIRPFRWVANALYEVIDRFLIDLIFVNGSAYVVDIFGRVARWIQNGQVQRYLVAVVVGTALIFYFWSSPDVSFDYSQGEGYTVEFTPEVGKGLDAKGAVIEFDMHLDGEPEFSEEFMPGHEMVFEWTFSGPGDYKVKMTMTDSVFNKKYSVTRTIHVTEHDANEGGAK